MAKDSGFFVGLKVEGNVNFLCKSRLIEDYGKERHITSGTNGDRLKI